MDQISEQDVITLEQKWCRAIIERDIKAITVIYTENAVLKPTLSAHIRQGLDSICPYFTGGGQYKDLGFFKGNIIKVQFHDRHIQTIGQLAVDVGTYDFITDKGQTYKADYTFVLQKHADKSIQILSHHSSLVYE